MNKNASLRFRLSDKEIEILENIKRAYNINNTSEIIRVLIRQENDHLQKLEGLNNLSDKQIIKLGLYTNCTTKSKRKEG